MCSVSVTQVQFCSPTEQAGLLDGNDGDAWSSGNDLSDRRRCDCVFHQANRGRSALEVSSCKAHGRAMFDVVADVF